MRFEYRIIRVEYKNEHQLMAKVLIGDMKSALIAP